MSKNLKKIIVAVFTLLVAIIGYFIYLDLISPDISVFEKLLQNLMIPIVLTSPTWIPGVIILGFAIIFFTRSKK